MFVEKAFDDDEKDRGTYSSGVSVKNLSLIQAVCDYEFKLIIFSIAKLYKKILKRIDITVRAYNTRILKI